jgi:hypothetical protein
VIQQCVHLAARFRKLFYNRQEVLSHGHRVWARVCVIWASCCVKQVSWLVSPRARIATYQLTPVQAPEQFDDWRETRISLQQVLYLCSGYQFEEPFEDGSTEDGLCNKYCPAEAYIQPRQEHLKLSQELHEAFPEEAPYHLAIGLTWHALACQSEEEQLRVLKDACSKWSLALKTVWVQPFWHRQDLHILALERLWRILIDLDKKTPETLRSSLPDRDAEALETLRAILPSYNLERLLGNPFTALHDASFSALHDLGLHALFTANRPRHAVEIFARLVDSVHMEGEQDSWYSARLADLRVLLVSASISSSDSRHAQKGVHLLLQILPRLSQPIHEGRFQFKTSRDRLKLWESLLPDENIISPPLQHFQEWIKGADWEELQQSGLLDKIKLLVLLADSRFATRIGKFLAQVSVFFAGHGWQGTITLQEFIFTLVRNLHWLPDSAPDKLAFEVVATFLVDISVLGRFSGPALTDDRLWTFFCSAYERYKAVFHRGEAPFGSVAPNTAWSFPDIEECREGSLLEELLGGPVKMRKRLTDHNQGFTPERSLAALNAVFLWPMPSYRVGFLAFVDALLQEERIRLVGNDG